MQEQPREIHVARYGRDIQSTQNQAEPLGMLGVYLGLRSGGKEMLEAPVPESAIVTGRV
jgi:hypothetical protein